MLEEPHTPRDARPSPGALAAGFLGLVALTSGLIVLGALVRAHGAGLACPDWPLCFGQAIPAMNLEIAFEWSHRVVAGGVAVTFAALGVALHRSPAARAVGARAWQIGAALLAVQILLGALTVWHLLAAWTVTAHLVTGNSFNACVLWLALRLRDAAAPPRRVAVPAAARAVLLAAAALLALQIVLGGLVASRYAGLVCPEWPACLDGAWFPTLEGPIGLHLAHRTNAYAVVAALAGAAWLVRGSGRLGWLLAAAVGGGVAQVAVGVANVLLELPVEVTALHSALAAALVLALTAALYEARNAAPASP